MITRLLIFTIFQCLFLSGFNQRASDKVKEILYSEVVFKTLRDNYMAIQDEGKSVPRFLAKVSQNPGNISIDDFRREKLHYYKLVDEYNGLIEDIILAVNQMQNLKELKKISLLSYEQRARTINTDFQSFLRGLAKYNQEAFDPVLVSILIEIGTSVVKTFIDQKVETLKGIMVTELNNLKLSKIGWEEAEAVVRAGKPVNSQEQIGLIVNLGKANHFKTLELPSEGSMNEVDSNYKKLKIRYQEQRDLSSNPDIQEYFSYQLTNLDGSYAYFKANPPQPVQNPVQKGPDMSSNSTQQGNCRQQEIKLKIETLLDTFGDEGYSKDQLIMAIQKVLNAY